MGAEQSRGVGRKYASNRVRVDRSSGRMVIEM